MKKLFILLAAVLMTISVNGANVKWALLDTPPSATEFHDGMAVFRDQSTDLYGAINNDGKIVIKPQYKRMEKFSGGMSIVTTDDGVGIINKKNQYVLPPISNCRIKEERFGDDFKKDNIGLYYIQYNDTKLLDIFYKNRFIQRGINDNFVSYKYPFIEWKDKEKDIKYAMNIEDGTLFQSPKYFNESNGPECMFYVFDTCCFFYDKKTGELMPDYNVSSKGCKLITINNYITRLVSATGDSIIEAFCSTPRWINDRVLFTRNNSFYCYGADGKLLFHIEGNKRIKYFAAIPCQNAFVVLADEIQKGETIGKSILFDYNGKELLSIEGFISNIEKNMFLCSPTEGAHFIYHTTNRKKIESGIYTVYPKDNVIVLSDKSMKFYIYDLTTDAIIQLNSSIKSVYSFSEGVAMVTFNNNDDGIIDKKGNIVLRENDALSIRSVIVSEDVIAVQDKNTWTYGFIYNPIGAKKYVYDKTANNDNLMQEGWELLKKRKYAKAKDYYYDVIINDPLNVDALINYAVCLNGLGYYESAIDATYTALQIDPNNELAQKNLQIYKNNNQAAQQNANTQYTWFDGLTMFLNVLGQTTEQFASFYNDMNASRNSSYLGGNNYNSNSSGGHQTNDSMYKNQDSRTYSDLESQLIKMNTYYNTYNNQQRISIQQQMRNIRRKWENRGYNMFHSSWEDWDGSKR